MRLFFGIELEPEIKDNLDKLRQDLSIDYKGIKWVEKENLHITLEFIGELSNDGLEKLKLVTKDLKFPMFNLELQSIGGFPYLKKPRVVWVGLKENKQELMKLYQDLYKKCKLVKDDLDERPYHPHVTLARIKKPLNKYNIEKLEKYKETNFGLIKVKNITLYKSELNKTGPVYKIIKRIFYSDVEI